MIECASADQARRTHPRDPTAESAGWSRLTAFASASGAGLVRDHCITIDMEIDMNTKSLMATTLALVMLGASGWSVAAGSSHGAEGPKSGAQDKGHDMMMGHMMGGGGMMGSCPMMGLPPGNEKLSMQMHADMMQAMGEIMRKYADKIQTPPMK